MSMTDNRHAAMCIYCGEAVIYDTRQVIDMEAAHQKLVEHDQQCPKNPLVAERQALARKLAMIELAWDRCEGRPMEQDRRELHRLIIDTDPHVDDELAAIRGEERG